MPSLRLRGRSLFKPDDLIHSGAAKARPRSIPWDRENVRQLFRESHGVISKRELNRQHP